MYQQKDMYNENATCRQIVEQGPKRQLTYLWYNVYPAIKAGSRSAYRLGSGLFARATYFSISGRSDKRHCHQTDAKVHAIELPRMTQIPWLDISECKPPLGKPVMLFRISAKLSPVMRDVRPEV